MVETMGFVLIFKLFIEVGQLDNKQCDKIKKIHEAHRDSISKLLLNMCDVVLSCRPYSFILTLLTETVGPTSLNSFQYLHCTL